MALAAVALTAGSLSRVVATIAATTRLSCGAMCSSAHASAIRTSGLRSIASRRISRGIAFDDSSPQMPSAIA
jgi:hypothetical protein